MKATIIQRHGDPSVLTFMEMPDPVPQVGDVLVRVRAAALNRLDLYTRAGIRGTRLTADRFPHILGGDCAGDIVDAGASGWRAGQRVVVNPYLGDGTSLAMLGTNRPGSYAELVAVPAANVVPVSDSLSYEQAAALPTVFLPAHAIVVREGRMSSSETALVLSASSGVGTAAIQVVKRLVGAKCIAVTSTPAKADAALALGADHVINYAAEDMTQRVKEITKGRGVDLVIDPSGAQFFETAYALLAPHGRYGVCGVTAGYEVTLHLGLLFAKRLSLFGVFMGSTPELRDIVGAAERGLIRPAIHARHPLRDARLAHEAMERAEHFGKIILTVD